jgi:hypothetical protein
VEAVSSEVVEQAIFLGMFTALIGIAALAYAALGGGGWWH